VGVILTPGLTFGAYKIVAPLGRGGMGEVYRARDTRLGRDVALKILREDGASDPERVRRFEDEARAASSLNHPNIVVIYEVGEATVAEESQPTRFLAMEFLDGQPLNEIIGGGARVPIRRFLEIAAQLTDGLARAHENGIVHRDLKPSNVIVTGDDHVKILDFGLAKLRSVTEEGSSSAPTRDETETAPGTVLGTVGYMSPEQVRGEPVTPASDQFSLGCIFYEMLTGNRPFRAPSSADVMSAILRDDPTPIAEASPGVPDPICWIVDRCLAKSASRRYVSTRDLARDLQNLRGHILESKPRMSVGATPPPRRRWWRAAAAAAAMLLTGAGAALLLTRALRPTTEPDFRRLTFRRGVVWRALFVPNSDNIFYTAAWDGAATRSFLTIPESSGSDRGLDTEDQLPMAYSRDGSQLLVLLGPSRAAINLRGTLAWKPALGGTPRPILPNAGWADWSETPGRLAVVRDTGTERLLEIRHADGTLERAIFHTPGGISYVRFSPDADAVAFIHHPSRYDDGGEIRLARTDGSGSIALTSRFERCVGLDWNERTREIWFTGSRANISTTTLWTLSRSGRLRSIRSLPDFFALQDVSASGERILGVSGAGGTGILVRSSDGQVRDLSWLGNSMVADISPDGQRLLFTDVGATEKAQGIWVRTFDGGEAVRLGSGASPKFSPDGRSVVAVTPQRSGPQQVVLLSVDTGAVKQLTSSEATDAMPSFAGPTTILFVRSSAGSSEVWRMGIDGGGARSLGAPGCIVPAARPDGAAFLCRAGSEPGVLYVYPMDRGAGRRLFELPAPDALISIRWNLQGTEIYAVTQNRLFLVIDSATGAVKRKEPIDLGANAGQETLFAAVVDGDASTRAYSVDRFSSALYLATGFE
jgi:Tol biopolymer transport system component/predicted Ser/Thr protein kinase